jgi:hypothetical protein
VALTSTWWLDASFVIAAIDQHMADAGSAQFAEGDCSLSWLNV